MNRTNPRKKSVLQSTTLKGVGDPKSALTTDMKMKSLEFTQMVSGLAFVQNSFAMFPSICFGMVMYLLFHYMLEACDLFLGFDFADDYS